MKIQIKSESMDIGQFIIDAIFWFVWPGWLVLICSCLVIVVILSIFNKYQESIVECPNCGMQNRKKCLQSRNELGYEDGWHSETQTIETKTNNFSNNYESIGTSYSTSEITTPVPHRTISWRENYLCPVCENTWSLDYWRRFNL